MLVGRLMGCMQNLRGFQSSHMFAASLGQFARPGPVGHEGSSELCWICVAQPSTFHADGIKDRAASALHQPSRLKPPKAPSGSTEEFRVGRDQAALILGSRKHAQRSHGPAISSLRDPSGGWRSPSDFRVPAAEVPTILNAGVGKVQVTSVFIGMT